METGKRPAIFEWRDRVLEDTTLTFAQRTVGARMGNKANGVGQPTFVSNAELAERLGMSDKTVRDARKALERAGWTKTIRRGGRNGAGQVWATEYVLTFPARRSQGWGAAAQPVIHTASTGG